MWYMYIYEITLYGMKRLEQFIFYFRVLVQLKLIFILMYEKTICTYITYMFKCIIYKTTMLLTQLMVRKCI